MNNNCTYQMGPQITAQHFVFRILNLYEVQSSKCEFQFLSIKNANAFYSFFVKCRQKLWPTKPGELRRGKELFQFAGRATETSVNCSHICPRSNQSLNRTAIWQADKSKRNGKEMLGFIAFINPTAGLPIWWRPSCGPQAPDCLSI